MDGERIEQIAEELVKDSGNTFVQYSDPGPPKVEYIIDDEIEARLQAMGEVQESGRFVIDVITAGTGNGWEFSQEVLQDSLDLWNGAEVFIDHGGFFQRNRSVRDLGGVLSNPRWNSGCSLQREGR